MLRTNPTTGRPYANTGINPGYGGEYSGNYGDGEYGNQGGFNIFGHSTGPNLDVSTETNPDIGQSQKDLRRMAGQVDPQQRARDAIATARDELLPGMQGELASFAQRGIGKDSGAAQNVMRSFMSEGMRNALKAGETAKYGGEELKLNALGQGLNAAEAQANSQFQRQQLQTQAAMQQWQEQMQQQREAQNRILDQMLSGVSGGGLSGGADLSGAGGLPPAGPTGQSVARSGGWQPGGRYYG